MSKHVFTAIESLLHWISEQISPRRQLKNNFLQTMQEGLLEQNTNTMTLLNEDKYQQDTLKTFMAHS